MSSSSVITNEETKEKRGCAKTDYCRPKFAILNPRLTYTLPQYQTESGCVDILMHTMERYFVNIETMEITDSISEALMQTVIYNARILNERTRQLQRQGRNYVGRKPFPQRSDRMRYRWW